MPLTKTLFKLGATCPTRVYYASQPQYANHLEEDSFLEALIEGGFQVGTLAQCYHPDGLLISRSTGDIAVQETSRFLVQNTVTLFEAAFQYDNLYVVSDIIVKTGNQISLIEVKAKSYDADDDEPMFKKRGQGLQKKWKPYLLDVAFQKYVLQKCFPDHVIQAHLMMLDKRVFTTVDSLHQKFRIQRIDNRPHVELMGDTSPQALGVPIMVTVNVDRAVASLFDAPASKEWADHDFSEFIDWLATNHANNEKIEFPVGVQCKDCPFHANREQEEAGLQSGYKECWHTQKLLNDDDFVQPSVFDLWDYRKTQDLLNEGLFFLKDIDPDRITPSKTQPQFGLSTSDRQRLQITKLAHQDTSEYLDSAGLKHAFANFTYPLHFIDFETNTAAIPFNRGRRPYETIAFQFSHHTVSKDGHIEHVGQYLNCQPGIFPNFEFVRALQAALTEDKGTIFRYASHENSVLNAIYTQLLEAKENIPDRDELCTFIRSITKSSRHQSEDWEGQRTMVDLLELVKRFYYSPLTNGSNSIKKILPAILNHSRLLQQKYSKPIYGSDSGIRSLNFTEKAWIKIDDAGLVIDPYALLEPINLGLTDTEFEYIDEDEELADGGAATIAYNLLQYKEMSYKERSAIEKSLLNYCELDTFAMVLIWEHWAEQLAVS